MIHKCNSFKLNEEIYYFNTVLALSHWPRVTIRDAGLYLTFESFSLQVISAKEDNLVRMEEPADTLEVATSASVLLVIRATTVSKVTQT